MWLLWSRCFFWLQDWKYWIMSYFDVIWHKMSYHDECRIWHWNMTSIRSILVYRLLKKISKSLTVNPGLDEKLKISSQWKKMSLTCLKNYYPLMSKSKCNVFVYLQPYFKTPAEHKQEDYVISIFTKIELMDFSEKYQ